MIQSFLQYIRYEKNYSSHTVLSYQIDIEQLRDFIVTQKGDFDPKKLTTDELREWVVGLMDVGEKPSSVKRKISAVRSFYKFLNLKGLTDNNPTLKIIAPKVPKSLPKFFYEKDLDKCLEISEKNCNFEGVRNSLIIELIYQTGLRRSEVANLEDANVDVVKQHLKVLGKGNKERVVPFGTNLAEKIEVYRAKRDEEVDVVTTKFFVHKKGTSLNPMHIYNVVRKLMGAVTTQEKRSPHVLRHTFATSLLNDGADVKAIKELLGHETLAATQVYTHASFDQIKTIYERTHPRGKK
jgi:integrase/recombinase XerC